MVQLSSSSQVTWLLIASTYSISFGSMLIVETSVVVTGLQYMSPTAPIDSRLGQSPKVVI